MKISVIGNCQVWGLADVFTNLLPDAEVHAFEIVGVRRAGSADAACSKLRESDLILSHSPLAALDEFSEAASRGGARDVHMIPAVAFTGFHPDVTYINRDSASLAASALGPYHSNIVAAAFSLGLDQIRAATLFNQFAYRALGYFDEFTNAKFALESYFKAFDLDIAPHWPRLLSGSAFMHTINHPRMKMLEVVGKLVAARLGLKHEGADNLDIPYDWLSGQYVWPVYPELGRAIGVGGSYRFKRGGEPDLGSGKSLYMGKQEFISATYEIYKAYPISIFDIEPIERAKNVLRQIIR